MAMLIINEELIQDCISLAKIEILIEILWCIYKEVEMGNTVVLAVFFKNSTPFPLREIRNMKSFLKWLKRYQEQLS